MEGGCHSAQEVPLEDIRESAVRSALVYGDWRERFGKNHGDSERPVIFAFRRNSSDLRDFRHTEL